MYTISVNSEELCKKENQLKNLALKIASTKQYFSSISSSLDTDIKIRQNINYEIDSLDRALDKIQIQLYNTGDFIRDTSKAYHENELQLKLEFHKLSFDINNCHYTNNSMTQSVVPKDKSFLTLLVDTLKSSIKHLVDFFKDTFQKVKNKPLPTDNNDKNIDNSTDLPKDIIDSDITTEIDNSSTESNDTVTTYDNDLYATSKLYKHETDLISQINSIDTTSFNWDINNFNKIYDNNKKIYEDISSKTGLPPELIAAIHYRESGCNFNTYLHNGDPLGKPTTHVPIGKNFDNFTDAAIDALSEKKHIRDQYKLTSDSNDMSAMMSFAERYNGLGYYNKDRISPYVYSGTNVYTGGKYVADGKFSSEAVDKQPGVYLLINSLKE
ncbi:hypothetical protein [Vallitalea maricola]|uniref:Uncharacterized protein n=1 Tax=Vallitalea maricola TaxID=3074433 RepID=A0ACB5UGJ5_9FIRM|nr:hypothetical protein AN2V17_09120 [Vallitalea sp. AN17-2]